MNKINTIYLLHKSIGGKYIIEFMRSDGKSRTYYLNTFDHFRRISRISALLYKHCAILDVVRYHVSTLTVYLPIRLHRPPTPVKTRPITGLNVSTKAGVYRVEFYRDNALRGYKITDWKRVIVIDSLLKQHCEVAEVNLFSCGQVSIWYNMKESK